ncbi:MAG TPA: pyridoxamine 5'-phosphate oxidase family protein [Chitinophagaceae bacterium]|jgi:nitroimidazol reductase NimA-like FMN-containing flavoprotein (pyridoxamine 5'-phosphate oxidase superfamily)|nr:pyridoxamine 5'-phosphate oxidase family protein [Chitinophagaceae bacterium]
MFGKMSDEEMDILLKKQFVGHIGCHANGTTYIVPISYVYDAPYVYAHSFKGMKIDIMRQNPKVCFQVDNTRNLANWESVVCQGEFEEINEKDDRRSALRKLNSRALPVINSQTMHLGDDWPFDIEAAEEVDGIFFRIKLIEKTGRFEKADGGFFFAS